MKLKITILLLILFIFSTTIFAQNVLKSNIQKSDLIVKGTSSLHDWNMVSNKFNCSITVQNNAEMVLINDVKFTCNSNSLKSENSIMDKKAWDALKTDEFKFIQFNSNELIELKITSKKTEGKIDGELILLGIKKKISLPYKSELDELGNLNIKGEISIKMSEFSIEPPTALMGTIKTGDVITISFQVVFDQINLVSVNK